MDSGFFVLCMMANPERKRVPAQRKLFIQCQTLKVVMFLGVLLGGGGGGDKLLSCLHQCNFTRMWDV